MVPHTQPASVGNGEGLKELIDVHRCRSFTQPAMALKGEQLFTSAQVPHQDLTSPTILAAHHQQLLFLQVPLTQPSYMHVQCVHACMCAVHAVCVSASKSRHKTSAETGSQWMGPDVTSVPVPFSVEQHQAHVLPVHLPQQQCWAVFTLLV